MSEHFDLINKVRKYDPTVDVDALERAYMFSKNAHSNQIRASGDPYFSHPLQVANILADMKLDDATIITALLHDTVEDTYATLDDIRQQFGTEIASLVDGVTKLSRIKWESDKSMQAENFRKLLLAMSEDMRVLLVKLADRLHNMRTLSHLTKMDKRKRIARETMEIYAPLAERIGVHHIKEELQDLAFAELNQEARDSLIARLHFLRENSEQNIQDILKELSELFEHEGLKAKTIGREKRPYSIWEKMRRQNINFEQLTDIMAFRVIVDSLDDCYRTLGIIHSHYPVIPGRFKDYISTPKPNNYRSIHTAVYGPKNFRIEIQIRTKEMNEIAENGVAAHWQYKQHEVKDNSPQYQWLRGLLDILENTSNPEEFLEHTKLEMFQDQVFCFTPAGDLITLPQGSTPIDFAYAIHSEVGNHCVSAKRNGRVIPLRTILKNGDQVEIITSPNQTPSPTWERFVVTGKARANIRRFVRATQRVQYTELGKAILHKALKHAKISSKSVNYKEILDKFLIKDMDDLYAKIGEGLHTAHEVLSVIQPERESHTSSKDLEFHEKGHVQSETSVSLKGLIPGMAIHYAGCCHPLPGDRIVGIVITGRGVTIHTSDCETLEKFEDEPERWLDVAWDEKGATNDRHTGRLTVILLNKSGALAALSTIISQQGANILNLKITNRTESFFEILIDLEVRDYDHLSNVMAAMRASQLVNVVERTRH